MVRICIRIQLPTAMLLGLLGACSIIHFTPPIPEGLEPLPGPAWADDICVSPDGAWLAAVGGRRWLGARRVFLYDEELRLCEDTTTHGAELGFSSDSHHLLVYDQLWSSADLLEVPSLDGAKAIDLPPDLVGWPQLAPLPDEGGWALCFGRLYPTEDDVRLLSPDEAKVMAYLKSSLPVLDVMTVDTRQFAVMDPKTKMLVRVQGRSICHMDLSGGSCSPCSDLGLTRNAYYVASGGRLLIVGDGTGALVGYDLDARQVCWRLDLGRQVVSQAGLSVRGDWMVVTLQSVGDPAGAKDYASSTIRLYSIAQLSTPRLMREATVQELSPVFEVAIVGSAGPAVFVTTGQPYVWRFGDLAVSAEGCR